MTYLPLYILEFIRWDWSRIFEAYHLIPPKNSCGGNLNLSVTTRGINFTVYSFLKKDVIIIFYPTYAHSSTSLHDFYIYFFIRGNRKQCQGVYNNSCTLAQPSKLDPLDCMTFILKLILSVNLHCYIQYFQGPNQGGRREKFSQPLTWSSD